MSEEQEKKDRFRWEFVEKWLGATLQALQYSRMDLERYDKKTGERVRIPKKSYRVAIGEEAKDIPGTAVAYNPDGKRVRRLLATQGITYYVTDIAMDDPDFWLYARKVYEKDGIIVIIDDQPNLVVNVSEGWRRYSRALDRSIRDIGMTWEEFYRYSLNLDRSKPLEIGNRRESAINFSSVFGVDVAVASQSVPRSRIRVMSDRIEAQERDVDLFYTHPLETGTVYMIRDGLLTERYMLDAVFDDEIEKFFKREIENGMSPEDFIYFTCEDEVTLNKLGRTHAVLFRHMIERDDERFGPAEERIGYRMQLVPTNRFDMESLYGPLEISLGTENMGIPDKHYTREELEQKIEERGFREVQRRFRDRRGITARSREELVERVLADQEGEQ